MRYYSDVTDVCKEINSYVAHFSGAPLIVGIDNGHDYRDLLNMLMVDPEKQVIRMSDSCLTEFPPNPTFQVSSVGNAAKSKPVVWIGAAQSIMLYGQQETERFLLSMAGASIKGPVVLLCPFCCGVLESIGRNYQKLSINITTMKSVERDIPSICFHADESSCGTLNPCHGIKELIQALEIPDDLPVIHVITGCDRRYLSASIYPYIESVSAYHVLCQKEPMLAMGTIEANGTDEQWKSLAKRVAEAGSFTALCESHLGVISQLPTEFADYMNRTPDDAFLCFIALKVYYGMTKDYLGVCLVKCTTAEELLGSIYKSILDINPDDGRLPSMIRQRRRILRSFDENSALMKDYCDNATIYGRNILRYLSDDTEEERAALIHALCTYDYSQNEMISMLRDIAPELSLYLRTFTFDSFNTRVMESDASVRDLLTNYFQQYKVQKITNRQEKDFISIVEKEAQAPSFTKLQARSSVVKKLDKSEVLLYFFDALGVEFLAYIEAKAEQYGMLFECQVCHCNLPSITSKNKEFYEVFPEEAILKEDRIDALVHHGTKYDFRVTTEPIYIFDELAVLDQDIKKMGALLAADKAQRIVIFSDHGSSRLAVTYQSENDKLELDESGKHSGRCCPTDKDPHIPFARYEDGFSILSNYERFKGSRKADVEAHGGASLEEVVVPVITLTLKPKVQQIYFPESTIKCSAKDGSSIMLFANPPLHEPRMVISAVSYSGIYEGDKHNVRFTMTDIRRKGTYDADIYDGNKKVASLSFETKRSTSTIDLI